MFNEMLQLILSQCTIAAKPTIQHLIFENCGNENQQQIQCDRVVVYTDHNIAYRDILEITCMPHYAPQLLNVNGTTNLNDSIQCYYTVDGKCKFQASDLINL